METGCMILANTKILQWPKFGISVDGQVYNKNQSIRDIYRVTDILSLDRCVTVLFISLQALKC